MRFAGRAILVVPLVLAVACQSREAHVVSSPAPPAASPAPSAQSSKAPLCASARLSLKSLGILGIAAGNYVATFRLTNTGSGTCDLMGFPGFTLIGNGVAPKVALDDGGGYIPVPTKRVLVVLEAGAAAEFQVEGTDFDGQDNRPWPRSTMAKVYPPGNTGALEVAVVLPLPDKASEKISVSPVEAPGCLSTMTCP